MNNDTVIIVDDNEADRYLLRRDLEEVGHTGKILEAEQGQQALNLLEELHTNPKQKISTIFLDINMPLMGGFEFLQHYSKHYSASPLLLDTNIIMYSSSDRQEDKDKVIDMPFVKGFLVKGAYQAKQLENLLHL